MRKFHFLLNSRRPALAASLRGAREVLYAAWALMALAFCGLVAAGLL